jgi:hypothetical protein
MLITHPKLSANVQTLLEWFASDTSHAVEWCTSVGRSMDKLVIIGDSPIHSIRPALNTLIQYGLLQQNEVFYTGMRWTRLTVAANTSFQVFEECEDDHS